MSEQTLILTVGEWPDGLGLRLTRRDRDDIFDKSWNNVQLQLGKRIISISLTDSFWNKCHEFKSRQLALWIKSKNLHRWEKGNPPKMKIKHLGENRFQLIGLPTNE